MWLDPPESDPTVDVYSEATYSLTFRGLWTTAVTSGGLPGGAHFTNLIGGVHNAGVTFLRDGGRATAGVEFMAELGGTSTLASEVRAAEPDALAVLLGSGNIGPTGSSTINDVTLTTDHSRVTLLTMIAPSPDWFVGVSGLSLLDDRGEWMASLTVNLYPWDAGTEEGTEFSLANPATTPQGVITSIRGRGKFSNEPIATLTFTLQSVEIAEIAPELLISTLVSGLTIPWDLDFTPDGTMLFTEKRGVLSSLGTDGTVRGVNAEMGDLFAVDETGLMGIVVDPDFASNRRFYTCQGHVGPEVQVIAWAMNGTYTAATRVADPLVGGIPATSGRHGGCRLRFGPEGYLWIATGDAASGSIPQDLASLGGKVLRVDPSTGAGAETNPLAAPRIYSYGHRNVQGLALRPGTSQMWAVEHGPRVDDEINLLVAGGNYGWDPVPGYNESVPMTDRVKFPRAVEAKWSSGSPTLAVSGGIFLEGKQWGVWEGRLAVATLRDSRLRLFEFTSEGAFVGQVIVSELDRSYGRLRTPMMGPDGALYVTTSNGGGRDLILRVASAESTEEVVDDPAELTEADLEDRRLTLNVAGEGGAARTLELRFGEGNRFEQTESGAASRSGTITYEKTGPRMGTVRLDYDDGTSCELRLSFSESGEGTFAYDCGDGSPDVGSFRLTTGSLFVPVILSSAGLRQSFFTSELTLTNRGEKEVELDYTYSSRDEPERRSGRASDVLPAGRQKIETNALTYLAGLGIPIPEAGNQLGTLRVEAPPGSEVEAVVRTTTIVPDGRAGLAYPGVAEEEGFSEPVYLCGLRQNSQDRSNVAFQNMGAPGEGAITLKTSVYSGEASDTSPRELDDITLGPGGFYQYSGLLGGVENGYVKVERVEGEASFYAYGVINDQANSDGSFIFPVTASSLEGKRRQTLPVIVETRDFTSELTVTNFSEEPSTLNFEFVSEQIQGDDKTVGFQMELKAGEQQIVAELVEALRREEMAGLGERRGFYLGALFVTAEEGDLSGVVIGARTSSQGGGGQYGVFYNAVPEGEGFAKEAWVEGLQQNAENRSNLALVNTGEVDGSPSVFHLEIYNGETGVLEETVVTKPIPARGWHQIDRILLRANPETRQGYVRIEKMSGQNPFLAYGVINDGGAPGQRSGDGAYLPARE
ncbi:MAG: PQQ-dependent sugar dehydrogenase [Acidobacteriota bacterium]|nr:PQQ-dependent sugar dehydrogenase [Acidobacteriota bacterium]